MNLPEGAPELRQEMRGFSVADLVSNSHVSNKDGRGENAP